MSRSLVFDPWTRGDRQTDQFIEVHIWGELSNALKGADLETLTMDAEPPLRDAFTRWTSAARALVVPEGQTSLIERRDDDDTYRLIAPAE